ncbi:type II secretion system F family protein [Shewanella schlegeliana]|uniref:Type II secretion system F family protein n=1 Tax=Shewanella schlegeliana TaxID=190308 RepID=A0ABS1SZ85_9GAMM|nr:type II secretion system F family protein [Shewanella schlegeliana]MBL4913838.1 type II secretion system F family protein [Shewanella schlegeliana]MCL1108778.1 type II secretion system F family protein [Shewanella schlegeliana]GIU26066.1 pilus assembly protein TadB [Shewanella schlegeliana]
MFSNQVIFLGLVFVAVLFLSQALFLPVYSPQRANTALVRKRLKKLSEESGDITYETSLLRKSRLGKLGPIGRWLEHFQVVENLSYRLELADYKLMGHQFIFLAVLSASIAAFLAWAYLAEPIAAALMFVVTLFLFNFKLNRDTAKRMDKIEESFPDALDVLRRALQAGYSFSDAVKLVTEEMEGPLAKEFSLMFANINYSKDTKRALLGFIERVPSVSAMAFASAVMVQKETGGNLAENINNLARVIRLRFTFRRRVRTLSAEGRLSAWILILLPFVLFAVIYIQTPGYVGELTGTEEGNQLLIWGAIGMFIGGMWISKLIRIDM